MKFISLFSCRFPYNDSRDQRNSSEKKLRRGKEVDNEEKAGYNHPVGKRSDFRTDCLQGQKLVSTNYLPFFRRV